MINSKAQHEQSAEQLLGELTAEFLDQVARGEHPQAEEYARRHSHIADLIRDIFPVLDLIKYSEGESAAESGDVSLDPNSHQQLGDFRIIREIGRGGMGVVYEALQLSMPRKVALKVLPFATLVDEKRLKRFTNEVHAAATLDHPNIVSVYSVGEDRGVHYYAMQLVRGPSVAEVIEHLRQLGDNNLQADGSTIHRAAASADMPSLVRTGCVGPSEKKQSPRPATDQDTQPKAGASTIAIAGEPAFYQSVAALGVQVAKALEHAHDHGIVHRDIKPANLMLDAHCKPYITDFGLARIGADSDMTMTGDVVGTIRYMSPEQALAKSISVDQRVDVYSLGVTLYEMITLRPAFDGGDREELLKQIAFEEPIQPRRINKNIPRDLETIVLKAMAKEPEDRYARAQGLADDLERFLNFHPIGARRPTLFDRGRKLIRRHAVVAGLTCLLLLVATIGSISSAWIVARERDKANHERELANAHLNTARNVIDSLLVGMAEELEHTPAATNFQRKLLENALAFYEDFPKEVMAKPGVRGDMALAFQRAGEVRRKLGRLDDRRKACELYERAAAIYGDLVEEIPTDDGYHLGLAKTLRLEAEVLSTTTGIESSRTPSQLYQKSRHVLEALTERKPGTPLIQKELASTLLSYGALAWDDVVNRREAVMKGVALRRELVARFPGDEQFSDALAGALSVYSDQLARDSQHELEERARRESLKILQRLADGNSDNRRYHNTLMSSYVSLGVFLRDRERYEESDEAFAVAIPRLEKAVQDYPNTRGIRAFLLWALGNQRDSLLQRQMLKDASQVWDRFLRHRRAMLEYDKDSTGQKFLLVKSLDAQGTILYEVGELQQARRAWQECLLIARQLAEDAPDSLDLQGWFAWISATCPFTELRTPEEAALAAAKAVELSQGDVGEELVVSGWCKYRASSWPLAQEEFNRAEGISSYSSLHAADRELGLAATKWRMGHAEGALEHYKRGKQFLEQDSRSGTAPYVTRRLSSEVGQLLDLHPSESRE